MCPTSVSDAPLINRALAYGASFEAASGGAHYFTKSRNGSRRLERVATSDTVVLSPPGMIRPSHCASCSCVRTSIKAHFTVGTDAGCVEAWCSSTICSWNAPCRANTPTVILVAICDWYESEELEHFLSISRRNFLNLGRNNSVQAFFRLYFRPDACG